MAGLLTVAFRKNRAQVRYWLWLSASLKFLVPFALLMSLGRPLGMGAGRAKNERPKMVVQIAASDVSLAVERIAQPFPEPLQFAPPERQRIDWTPFAIFGIWACGFAAIALIRFAVWLRIRAAVRASSAVWRFPRPWRFALRRGCWNPAWWASCVRSFCCPKGSWNA